MNITRVMFEKNKVNDKSLAVCSITFDDCLKVNKIRLFYKPPKGYYLVLPSKQDIFQEIEELNEGKSISLPEKEVESKEYEEFYFPIESSLYQKMLNTVVQCFPKYKERGVKSFRF